MGTKSRLLLAALFFIYASNLLAFSKEEALSAYSQINKVEFPVKNGDYIFFRYQWKIDQDATQEEREEKQLEAQFSCLEKYLCEGLQERRIRQSPFGEKLSKIILPPCNFNLSEIKMITVYEEVHKREHVVVFACKSSEIENEKQKLEKEVLQFKNYTEQQWASLLMKVFSSLKQNDDRRNFLTLLGCPIVVFLQDREIRYLGMEFDEKSQKAWQEIRTLLSWSADDSSFFLSRRGSPIWEWVWNTKGNVNLANTPQKDRGEFDAGKKLYHQGRDIPKIIELFSRSIELAPDSQEKWRYLGGILRVKKQYKDSLIAYLQMAKFGKFPNRYLETIQMLCKVNGMPRNAEGLHWYILMIQTKKQ